MMKEPIINIEKSSRILRQCIITNKSTGKTTNLRPVNCSSLCRDQAMSYLYAYEGGEYVAKFGGDLITMPQEDFCDLLDEILDDGEKARKTNEWLQDNVFGPMNQSEEIQ